MVDVYLLLGSNQGNAMANLAAARQHIETRAGKIVRFSTVYRSAAWGLEQQPDFHNQVLCIGSDLSPDSLLETLLDIERLIGRVRRERWGPRIIDIDILFYGNIIVNSDRLTLPHPGIPARRFTLLPMSEIAPEFLHPVLNQSMATLLDQCTDPLEVVPLN